MSEQCIRIIVNVAFCTKMLQNQFFFSGKDAKGPLSSSEVEAKLSAHMEKVKTKAAEVAKDINLPSYLNPAMINVNQFKVQQEKRKLLWSKKKEVSCIFSSYYPQG